MVAPRDLAAKLAAEVLSVCRELLPNGTQKGAEWCVGSLGGEKGESLKVHLTGERAGIWCDFATSDKGDLLDLWRECNGLTMGETIRQVKYRYGISDPDFHPRRRKEFRAPEKQTFSAPQSAVVEYLTGRGLTESVIARARIAEESTSHGPAAVFRYYRDGEHCHTKFLRCDRPDGKKITWSSKDTLPALYGWHLIPEKARKVVLTEGEIDCLTLIQFGLPALSVPNGGGRKQGAWLEHEFDLLERFDEILIAMDADQAGKEACAELVERLGSHRVRVVEWPEKDANDCLTKLGWGKHEFVNCLRSARVIGPEELANAADYRDQVKSLFLKLDSEKFEGIRPPWFSAHEPVEHRPGELTIWTGLNGHGKTTILQQLLNYCMALDAKVCYAGLEFPPERTLHAMVRQAAALPSPSMPFVDAIFDFYQDRLWLFKLTGPAKLDRLLDVFNYARARFGVTHCVLDSLMMLDIPEDDYASQKAAVQRFVDFALEHSIHFHLVAHGRKVLDPRKHIGRHGVKGSGGITDLAANVFVVWQNESKGEDDEPADNAPDAMLFVDKNRAHGWRGKKCLTFDADALQFIGGDWPRAAHMVPFSATAVRND